MTYEDVGTDNDVVLEEEALQILRRLADYLIPRGERMPSASEAGVPGQWLEAALHVRPDLVVDLQRSVAAARDATSVSEIGSVLKGDLPGWRALTTIVAGAYFLNPDVRGLIGYPGQVAHSSDPEEFIAEVKDGLLDGVITRSRGSSDVG